MCTYVIKPAAHVVVWLVKGGRELSESGRPYLTRRSCSARSAEEIPATISMLLALSAADAGMQ